MALGVDTIFTQECIKLSQIEKIIAAIPCYGQESIWRNESKKVYYELLKNEKVMPYHVAREYYNNKSLLHNIAILNENRIGVAGAPPPSLVLENFCL